MTTPVDQAVEAAEREKFEAWYENAFMGGLIKPEWDGKRNCYTEYSTHAAWKAWQARAELTRPLEVAAPVGNRTHVDSGALTMALNVLRRSGKDEVADALASTANRAPVDSPAPQTPFAPGSSPELNAIHAVVMNIGGDWPEVEGDPYTLHHVKRMAREIQDFTSAHGPAAVGQLCEEAFGRGQIVWFAKPANGSLLYSTPPGGAGGSVGTELQKRTFGGCPQCGRADCVARSCATPAASVPLGGGEVIELPLHVAEVIVSEDDLDMGFSEAFIAGKIKLPNGTHKLYTDAVVRAAISHPQPQPQPLQPQDAKDARPALNIDAVQAKGWRLNIDHAPLPVLYTDSINDDQVRQDNVWLVTTPTILNAARYEHIRNLSRAVYDADVDQRFILPCINRRAGQDLMRGSVAEHLDYAIDAAILASTPSAVSGGGES